MAVYENFETQVMQIVQSLDGITFKDEHEHEYKLETKNVKYSIDLVDTWVDSDFYYIKLFAKRQDSIFKPKEMFYFKVLIESFNNWQKGDVLTLKNCKRLFIDTSIETVGSACLSEI